MPRSRTCVALLTLAVAPISVAAAGLPFSAPDVPSVFFISKSENRNEIHYGLHVSTACDPAGAEPVAAYWLLREEGPGRVAPLLSFERHAYGIAWQRPAPDGVDLALRALPERTIHVAVHPGATACEAQAFTTIAGVRATLRSAHVVLGFLSVDHVVLRGATAGGVEVEERIE